MAGDFFPKQDAAAVAFAAAALATIHDAPADYRVVAADIVPLQTLAATLANQLSAVEAAKTALAGAVAAKDATLRDLETRTRALVRQIQANPLVTDVALAAAGLPIHDTTRTAQTPVEPSELLAIAHANGTNELRWNRAGNTAGCDFVIEAKVGAAAAFSQVDVVRASSYMHTAQRPGVSVLYQVRARRSGQTSAPSNTAGVYQV